MTIEWDGGGFEGPTYLFSICNGPRIGSMFRMAPAAQIDDGVLDFVLVPEVSKRTVLAILPRLLNGSHVDHPQVTTGRSRHFHITSRPTTPLHADGEILSEAISELTCRILPGKLTLLTTPPA
jgi:diacylglycerol kinase (ATP)